ncbi:hypothetical protein SAMN02745163_01650 [Clostridium cavendishii DSM 21758]|uniref:Uncharacterized protein n=1 Tax=Clostridium cavendishii DSM 21758 TaxID=1121302 RepID=A0A1M6I122_9CLOT|nr:hypothetical protein [Clostridium cavendishii]SHJ27954.1 hypothetical protein SAMN02745163_01650 [Clostridium cavendishii DSM 21758]
MAWENDNWKNATVYTAKQSDKLAKEFFVLIKEIKDIIHHEENAFEVKKEQHHTIYSYGIDVNECSSSIGSIHSKCDGCPGSEEPDYVCRDCMDAALENNISSVIDDRVGMVIAHVFEPTFHEFQSDTWAMSLIFLFKDTVKNKTPYEVFTKIDNEDVTVYAKNINNEFFEVIDFTECTQKTIELLEILRKDF